MPRTLTRRAATALAGLAVLTSLILTGCSSPTPHEPARTADSQTTQAAPADPDDSALTPREPAANVAAEEARATFLEVARASVSAAEVSGLTETSHFNGPNILTVVFDPTQPEYKAAYHNTEQPDRYILIFNRDYFTANYALRLANQTSTRTQANLDGSYTLFPEGDPIGYTYDLKNGHIVHAEGVDPKTGKTWATSLQYSLSEDGLTILSNAVNDLSN
jgi:hypothetical protein